DRTRDRAARRGLERRPGAEVPLLGRLERRTRSVRGRVRKQRIGAIAGTGCAGTASAARFSGFAPKIESSRLKPLPRAHRFGNSGSGNTAYPAIRAKAG